MSLSIEVVFKYMSIEPQIIWEKLIESHPDVCISAEAGHLYDKEITFNNVKDVIEQSHFNIEFQNAAFRYANVGNCDLSFLLIEECVLSLDDCRNWIKPFLKFDSFIQARVYDREYEYWQNATDPLEYEAAGKLHEHLSKKSNELPPPLEQMVIDTSNNPGRRVLRDGYVEAVGSVMWLGEPFWQVTGVDKKVVLGETWLMCKQEVNGVLSLRIAASRAFDNKTTEIQDRLRALLFQERDQVGF